VTLLLERVGETAAETTSSDLCTTVRLVSDLAEPAPAVMQVSPVHPSFRALSGRLKFTVRRHTFNIFLSMQAIVGRATALSAELAWFQAEDLLNAFARWNVQVTPTPPTLNPAP